MEGSLSAERQHLRNELEAHLERAKAFDEKAQATEGAEKKAWLKKRDAEMAKRRETAETLAKLTK
jgi:hypothetical protein